MSWTLIVELNWKNFKKEDEKRMRWRGEKRMREDEERGWERRRWWGELLCSLIGKYVVDVCEGVPGEGSGCGCGCGVGTVWGELRDSGSH